MEVRNYKSILSELDTEVAIKYIKDNFENELAKKLDLIRVSAPLFTYSDSGINDDLNGIERPVSFDIKSIPNKEAVVVHSLAKWKRLALARYKIPLHNGIYTDMNAIRRDENMDNIHSIYVDQWDWEKVISKEDRNLTYLKKTVRQIYNVMKKINEKTIKKYPSLVNYFPKNIEFVTSKKLLKLYPNLSSKERELEYAKTHNHAIFVIGIGKKLSNKNPHDLRAPDYDDWSLNGDIILYYPPLNDVVELSSMGIRVDKESLVNQLKITNTLDRLNLFWHKLLMEDKLPLSIGGGIGQSRMCLVMLNKVHIGEVEASIWDDKTIEFCKKHNIHLL